MVRNPAVEKIAFLQKKKSGLALVSSQHPLQKGGSFPNNLHLVSRLRIIGHRPPLPYMSERPAHRQIDSTLILQTVQTGIKKMGIVNWRKVAQDRVGLRRATREGFIFLG